MYIINRDQKRVLLECDQLQAHLDKLAHPNKRGKCLVVDTALVARKTCEGTKQDMPIAELMSLAADTAVHLMTTHPDYERLAARLEIYEIHKYTKPSFSEYVFEANEATHKRTHTSLKLIHIDFLAFVKKHEKKLDEAIDYTHNDAATYFGVHTLMKNYLLRINDKIVERPQYCLMREAFIYAYTAKEGILSEAALAEVLTAYHWLGGGWFTHASPTIFNAGTPKPQLSSCFLLTMKDDSIDGIYDTLKDCAKISKYAGGIGLAAHKIRATGSYIGGTHGSSNGLIPMLRVFNNTARYVDQGGGKRKGAFAIYIEPWHPDIFAFLDLRKNHGIEELRARDLNYGLWIPDLFMKRVKADERWTLFCPHEYPGLWECGDEKDNMAFTALYTKYEAQYDAECEAASAAKDAFPDEAAKMATHRAEHVIQARTLWNKFIDAQIETGEPYIGYKDRINACSNQKNVGRVESFNLCTEICQVASPTEIAVCNLASIALPHFVKTTPAGAEYDFELLFQAVRFVTKGLNAVIDQNHYPVPEAKVSNMRHRPIGIGVQGLADAFQLMRYAFDSPEAQELNVDIFETIHYAALFSSNELAKRDGPYPSYTFGEGSPCSKGILQCDMWNKTPSKRWNWEGLREEIKKHGIRNSLLTAPMPTATTSQMLGNAECFDPYKSNIFLRRTLAGEFTCIVRPLVLDLIKQGLWNDKMKDAIIRAKGSVQGIKAIPLATRLLYKTIHEIKNKTLVDMALDRAPFIDQWQSFTVYMKNATRKKLTSLHFYMWENGAKGMYYARTESAQDPVQVTLAPERNVRNRKPAMLFDLGQTPTFSPSSAPGCNADGECFSCGS